MYKNLQEYINEELLLDIESFILTNSPDESDFEDEDDYMEAMQELESEIIIGKEIDNVQYLFEIDSEMDTLSLFVIGGGTREALYSGKYNIDTILNYIENK